jgi:hypothetical protein
VQRATTTEDEDDAVRDRTNKELMPEYLALAKAFAREVDKERESITRDNETLYFMMIPHVSALRFVNERPSFFLKTTRACRTASVW